MANYQSTWAGNQVDLGVQIGLALASSSTTVTISSVTYKVLWKTEPTASNTVYGIALHPTNGKLYRIKAASLVYTAEEYVAGSEDLSAYIRYDEINVTNHTLIFK